MSDLKASAERTKKERKIGSVNLSSNELPEIQDWSISDQYEITLKVKMTSISEVDRWDLEQYSNLSKSDVMARFDIIKVISPKKEAAKKQRQDEKRGRLNNPVKVTYK